MNRIITLNNVEKLVFEDSELRRKMPRQHLFHTWALSKQSPELKAAGQKVMLEFLNTATDEEVNIISEHLKETIVIEKILTNVVEHYNFSLSNAEKVLNAESIIKEAFFLYREGEQLYISFWR